MIVLSNETWLTRSYYQTEWYYPTEWCWHDRTTKRDGAGTIVLSTDMALTSPCYHIMGLQVPGGRAHEAPTACGSSGGQHPLLRPTHALLRPTHALLRPTHALLWPTHALLRLHFGPRSDPCRPVLTHADPWADPCWPMLTRADLRWATLTRADAC